MNTLHTNTPAVEGWESRLMREIHAGQRVEVYRNLHKECWSVRDAKTKRVLGHCRNIALNDVSFHVSEAGRQRVLRNKQKNVHAYITGTVRDLEAPEDRKTGTTAFIKYNPYKHETFVNDLDEPVTHADVATLLFGHVVVAHEREVAE